MGARGGPGIYNTAHTPTVRCGLAKLSPLKPTVKGPPSVEQNEITTL